MIQKFDDLLNSITMYRLVLYGLIWLTLVAGILSLFGILRYTPFELAISMTILMSVGYVANLGLARLYKIESNFESGIITTLILFFVIAAPSKISDWVALAVAVFVAMASKYVIIWRGSHIFNPAAVGIAIISITGLGHVAWWIGTPTMLPFVAIVGLLILRKTRRFGLFFSFIIPSIALLLLNGNNIQILIFSFPLIFFATVMLTEPATSPNTNKWRLVYGVFVGTLTGLGLSLISTPHIALLAGNLLAFVVSFRSSTRLELVTKTKLAPNIYNFSFKPSRVITFLPGQYMEWTLANIPFNSRGNRRTFTIASSPGQSNLHIGIRFYEPSSAFKKKLIGLNIGDTIFGGHIAGDFTLPHDTTKKLVFVAGGIGITPFISMLQHMCETKINRDITLFYFVNSQQEFVYKDIIENALQFGIKLVPMVGPEARLSEKLLQKHVPDYAQHEYYLSGPPAMVRVYKKALKKLSVKKIHTDYFTGY